MKKRLLQLCFPFLSFLILIPGSRADSSPGQICIDGDVIAAGLMESMSCITAPVLICPSSSFGCPGDPTTPDHTGQATALPGDPACPDPVVTYTDEVIMNTPCVLKIHRKWRAEYPAGTANPWLYSECIQIIERVDEEAPGSSTFPSDTTLTAYGANCWVSYAWPDPELEDNCGISSIDISHPNGGNFTEGTTTVSYIVEDFCGNIDTLSFNVTVECEVCTDPPLISCPVNQWRCPVIGDVTPQSTGFATALPASAACTDPIVSFSDSSLVTGPCPGEMVIFRTWTAMEPSDSSLTSSCLQTIYVADTHLPLIHNMPQDIHVTSHGYGCHATVSWADPFPSDNCGILSFTSTHSSGASFPEGTTAVTYTATDNCGNTATASFHVTVNCISCVSPPVIHCPSDIWLCAGSNSNPYYTGYATASGGAHCPAPQVSYQDWIVSTGYCAGEKIIKRIWTASYPGHPGLSSSCEQFIYKEDISPPTIYNCPSDITLTYNNPVAWWTVPSAHDNCSSVSFSSNYHPGDAFPYGTTTVYYTATDACGNQSSCSFTVTVGGPPASLTCPSDIYVNCTSGGTAYVNWNPPVYSGNCGNCQTGQYIPGFIFMGEYNGHQYYCSTAPATWETARQICASKGGYLASINSHGENSFLKNQLLTQSAWIGLNDKSWEGHFEWVNGDPVNYTNWYAGQPNNYGGNQDYVELLSSGKWNDQYNHYALEFIMELPCSNSGSVYQVSGPSPGSYLSAGQYTVTYQLAPSCGAYATCSFDIFVSGGLEVECPDDITLQAPANSQGVAANWSPPTASSCCNSCGGSGHYIPGFVYMGSMNGHHYYCSVNPANWHTAKSNCEAAGGHLAVINNAQENSFLASRLTTQTAFIGLSDHLTEGHFKWVNGDALSYTNWYPGQPNNYGSGQDYVELLSNGLWNDQYGTASLEYIMEIPGCTNITQVAGPAPGSTLPPGTIHNVSYLVTDGCGNSAYCDFTVTVESANAVNYCLSGGYDSYEYHIAGVELGTIINNSSGSNDGYGDFTANCAIIQPDTDYQITLKPGDLSSSGETKYWKVWIDYNGDGDFSDQNEQVALGSGSGTLTGMISTPSYISPGKKVMRVSMSLFRYPNSPCEVFPVGETEDYCLLIPHTAAMALNTAETRDTESLEVVDISEAKAYQLHVWPNPAYHEISIETKGKDGNGSLKIYDATGKQVFDTDIRGADNIHKVDVTSWSQGLYLIHLQYDTGQQLTGNVIVNK